MVQHRVRIGNGDVEDLLIVWYARPDYQGKELYGTWETCNPAGSIVSWVIMDAASQNGK